MSKVNVVKLELKYCEHCGGLWLRRRGDRLLYCQGCRQIGLNSDPSNETRLHKERGSGGMSEELIH